MWWFIFSFSNHAYTDSSCLHVKWLKWSTERGISHKTTNQFQSAHFSSFRMFYFSTSHSKADWTLTQLTPHYRRCSVTFMGKINYLGKNYLQIKAINPIFPQLYFPRQHQITYLGPLKPGAQKTWTLWCSHQLRKLKLGWFQFSSKYTVSY